MRKDFVNFPAAPLFLLSKGYTNAAGRPKIGPEIILERPANKSQVEISDLGERQKDNTKSSR